MPTRLRATQTLAYPVAFECNKVSTSDVNSQDVVSDKTSHNARMLSVCWIASV